MGNLYIYKALHESIKPTSKLFTKMADDIPYNPDCVDHLFAFFDNIKRDLLREQADLKEANLEKIALEQDDLERDSENSKSPKDPVPSTNNEKLSNNKSFECPEEGCNMTFNRKDSLSRHSRTHSGDQPFSCTLVCKKNFSTRRSRDRHMQNKVCTK